MKSKWFGYKAFTSKKIAVVLLILALTAPLVLQTCTAQTTPSIDDKPASFIRDVIQLDLTHYKVTLEYNNSTPKNHTSLSYKLEPTSLLSLWQSSTMNIELYNDALTSFNIKPSSSIVYTQPQSDRFNQTLGIIERYQAWINDPQVAEMANLMRQVGSEKSTLETSGNMSLKIQRYSDIAEYRFSNYFNGAEYTYVLVAIGSSSGVYFSDNRASDSIGNTTIGVSMDQSIAIAENYVKAKTFPSKPSSSQVALDVGAVKAVNLKAASHINSTWYPYYEVQFNVGDASNGQQGFGVNVGANDGAVWSTYSYSSSTNTQPIFYPPINLLLLAAIVVGVIVAVLVGVSRKNRQKTAPAVVG